MNINFATCERNRALGFIQNVYPSSTITDTPDCAGPLLDLVEKDIIRIQDPLMHGKNIQVIPGKKYVENAETRAKLTKVCKEFHNLVTAGE